MTGEQVARRSGRCARDRLRSVMVSAIIRIVKLTPEMAFSTSTFEDPVLMLEASID